MIVGGLLALVASLPVAAHVPGTGNLVTTEDHLDPGTQFTVLGSELEAGASVTFWLVTATRVWPLGDAQVGQDGLVSAEFGVPPDMPLGDAWLYGKTATGSALELYVHVGPRAVSPEAAGSAPLTAALDERSIGIVLLAAGLVVVVVAAGLYLRGRSAARPQVD